MIDLVLQVVQIKEDIIKVFKESGINNLDADELIKELEKFEENVKNHFNKVSNPKLNTIRAINYILTKLKIDYGKF